MRIQHYGRDGIRVADVVPTVPKPFRAESLLSAEVGAESVPGHEDWRAVRFGDILGELRWKADLVNAAGTQLPVPRGSAITRAPIFPAVLTGSPIGAYDPQDRRHRVVAMRDIGSVDPDLEERGDGTPVYTGSLKVPRYVPALVMRGSGHLGAARAPLIFPFMPLVAQHHGVDVPDHSSMVHDTFDDAGESALSGVRRAALSTVFRVTDMSAEYPLKLGGSVAGISFRKVVALNFGPADSTHDIWRRPGAWHGSSLGAVHWGTNRMTVPLSISAHGPIGYSGDAQDTVTLSTPSGDWINRAALATLSLFVHNDASSPHWGRTGPMLAWEPGTRYAPKTRGPDQIPVSYVWDNDAITLVGGLKRKGAWRPVAWTDFKAYAPAYTTVVPPSTPGVPTSGGPPAGGGGGNPPGGGGGGGRPGGNPPGGGGGGPGGRGGGQGGQGDGGPRQGQREDGQDANGNDRPNNNDRGGERGRRAGDCERRTSRAVKRLEERLARAEARYAKYGYGSTRQMIESLRRKLAAARAREEKYNARRQARCAARKALWDKIAERNGWKQDTNRKRNAPANSSLGSRRPDGPVAHGGAGNNGTIGAIGDAYRDIADGGGGPGGGGGDGGRGQSQQDGHQSIESSVTTQKELESPSLYLHPKPAAPELDTPGALATVGDGILMPGAIIGPEGEPLAPGMYAGGVNHDEPDQWRKLTEGFTREEWNETPVGLHVVSAPTYNMALADRASPDPNRRYPPRLTQRGRLDADGMDGRIPSLGDASAVVLPGNLTTPFQFRENRLRLPSDIPKSTLMVGALLSEDGSTAVIDGRLGLGMRTLENNRVAGGWESSLREWRGEASAPDVDFYTKDALGEVDLTGKFFFNDIDIKEVSDKANDERWDYYDLDYQDIINAGGGSPAQETEFVLVTVPDGRQINKVRIRVLAVFEGAFDVEDAALFVGHGAGDQEDRYGGPVAIDGVADERVSLLPPDESTGSTQVVALFRFTDEAPELTAGAVRIGVQTKSI